MAKSNKVVTLAPAAPPAGTRLVSVDPSTLIIEGCRYNPVTREFDVVDPSHPLFDDRMNDPIDPLNVASILVNGLQQLPTVEETPEGLRVKDGRQRTRWCCKAGKATIDVYVKPPESKEDDIDKSLLSMELNMITVAPTPLAQAKLAKRALDAGKSKESVARAMGRSVETLGALLRVLKKGSDETHRKLEDKVIDETGAAVLASRTPEQQSAILAEAAKIAEAKEGLKEGGRSKEATATGETKIGVRDVREAIAKLEGTEVPESWKTKAGEKVKEKEIDANAPRTGSPKKDEIESIRSAVLGTFGKGTDVENAASLAAATVLAFILDGAAPSPAFEAKFPALFKALNVKR